MPCISLCDACCPFVCALFSVTLFCIVEINDITILDSNVTSMVGFAFDRSRAVAYASKYWNVVNADGYFWYSGGAYEKFAQGHSVVGLSGDDCAHFASHCIGANPAHRGGGLPIPSRVPPTYGKHKTLLYINPY